MIKILAFGSLAAFTFVQAHCQSLAKTPAFEVASITPCKPGTPEPPMEHAGMVQFVYPGGRFRANATSVKYLLEWAYGIQPAQHSDGPSWFGTDRYDIEAKAEGSATEDEMKLMAQTLLAERFGLKFHHESKEMSAYLISVGKTAPKLFPPKEGETRSLRFAPLTAPDQKITSYRVIATRYTLAQLTYAFARVMGSVFVNQTGFDGEYDFTLEMTPDESRPNPMDPSLMIGALREQLGLTLKSQKTPVDYLVIDSVDKVQAGN